MGCNQKNLPAGWNGEIICEPLILHFRDPYIMHYLPAADFYRLPRNQVRKDWARRNAKIILRREQGLFIVIPTRESIAQCFREGNELRSFPKIARPQVGQVQMVYRPSGHKFCLWRPSPRRVKIFQGELDYYTGDVYQTMLDTLHSIKRRMNILN